MRRISIAGLALLVTAGMVIVMAPASAGDSDVIRRGGCSASSTWKLKLSIEDGSIESELEVDQNVVGARWRVTLKNDGVRFFRGIRTTQAPSGSFEVRRLSNDGTGVDRIVGRARNLASDELCRGVARI